MEKTKAVRKALSYNVFELAHEGDKGEKQGGNIAATQ